MEKLSALENAVLRVIAIQHPIDRNAIDAQRFAARVTDRRNTGAGFYSAFEVDQSCPLIKSAVPLGKVTANVHGLLHGMGFLLWLEDGLFKELEGYSFEENTSSVDFGKVYFEITNMKSSI